MNKKIDERFGELRNALHTFQLRVEKRFGEAAKSRWVDRVWWLVVGGVILSVMARGFKWI